VGLIVIPIAAACITFGAMRIPGSEQRRKRLHYGVRQSAAFKRTTAQADLVFINRSEN
jgi:hypothetical protein